MDLEYMADLSEDIPDPSLSPLLSRPTDQELDNDYNTPTGLSSFPIPTNAPSYVVATLNDLNRYISEIQEPNQGFSTGWPGMDKALNKLQAGFHVICGDSNIGKTAIISQLAGQVYINNPDAYVLDISLDDPYKEKVSRVIASTFRLPINAVKNPSIIMKSHPQVFKRIIQGIDYMFNSAWRYRAVDSQAWGSYVEEIGQAIKELVISLKVQDKPLKLVVFIDNFHDLNTTGAVGNDKNKYDYIAQYISDLANELSIPIVCTGEFRKLNNFKRPSLDDIRESVKIKYEAKSIMLCHNEVGIKQEAAAVYYERKDRAEKQPVFEIKFGKNKYSSFKGRLFYNFIPEWAHFNEADASSSRRYSQAIYNSEG